MPGVLALIAAQRRSPRFAPSLDGHQPGALSKRIQRGRYGIGLRLQRRPFRKPSLVEIIDRVPGRRNGGFVKRSVRVLDPLR
jgi:hypothetical protein